MSTNVRTLQITNGGAIALYSVLRDVKWYTEVMDLMNAGAMAKLLEKKIPHLRDPSKIPESEQAAWMDKPITLKIGQSIVATVKTCLVAHARLGAFMGTPHIMLLFSQVGIEFEDHTDELMAMNEDEASAG